ncbi:MAG: hypothetical protein J0M17_01620 [Planctomycetes bacterium]|nr:hypothetical protein [Planctomycetota bacterium]
MPGVDEKPLGENTAKFLDDVKKGKSRSFLLVCKGPKVVFLSVKKKPVKKNELNDAKKDGFKGDPYFGVITGKGMDLVFNLAQADGYDKPPVKEVVLRDFLEEHAGLKCKPTFQVVPESPAIPFDDDDLQNPHVARFMKLEEPIALYVENPANQAQIQTLTTLIKETRLLLQGGDFVEGAKKIDEIERIVKSNSPNTAADPGPSAAELAMTFAGRLKVLKPDIDKVLAADLASTQQLKTLVAEAGTAGRDKKFAHGLGVLDQIEPLLKQAVKELEQRGPTTEDPGAAFNNRLKTLLPKIKEAVSRGVNSAQQIQQLAGEAGNAAKQKQFAQAHPLLDQVEALLGQLGDDSRTLHPQFAQKWEEAKTGWGDAIDVVNAQFEKLRVALINEEDEELKRIAEFSLNAVTGDHRVPLQAAILDVDRAAADKKTGPINKARTLIEEFRDHIDTDDQVEACDDNPFEVKVTIRETLEPALKKMDQVLATAFGP